MNPTPEKHPAFDLRLDREWLALETRQPQNAFGGFSAAAQTQTLDPDLFANFTDPNRAQEEAFATFLAEHFDVLDRDYTSSPGTGELTLVREFARVLSSLTVLCNTLTPEKRSAFVAHFWSAWAEQASSRSSSSTSG